MSYDHDYAIIWSDNIKIQDLAMTEPTPQPTTESTAQPIIFKVEQKIAYVQLNRPEKHNALDFGMFKALANVQKQIKRDKSIRVVILQGNGASFCSGLDIKSLLSNKVSALKLLWKWLPGNSNLAQKVSTGWRKLPVPVISVIQGKCFGGGMQIILGTDFRIATPTAEFSIMESRWGLIPDMGGSLGLRECVSKDHAMRLSMTAEELTADKALDIGLISQVADEPIKDAEKFAKQIIERSPDAIRQIKKLYRSRWHSRSRHLLSGETLAQWKVLMGKNQSIAVKRQMGKDIPYQ